MASLEIETPIKQCITVLDKKVRNLEKRKVKLDAYRDKANSGEVLDKDQQEAVAKYEVVIQNLEFSRELQKQFQQISNDTDKQIRKQSKRDKIEKGQQEVVRLQSVLKLQSVLDSLGNEQIRADFKTGTGSKKLSDEDLEVLDEFYQAIVPTRELDISFEEQLSTAAEHIWNFVESSDKPVRPADSSRQMSYDQLNQLVNGIYNCGYFEKKKSQTNEEQSVEAEVNANEPIVETQIQQNIQQELATTETPDQWVQHSNEYHQDYTTQTNAYTTQSNAYTSQANAYTSQANAYTNAYTTQANAYTSEADAFTAETGAFTNAYISEANAYVYADEAGVYTHAYKPRPLQEIVSSMQGNYNFLQDSEIDVDGNHVNQISTITNIYDTPVSSYMGQFPAGVGTQNLPSSELQNTIYMQDNHRHYTTSPAYVEMVVGPPPIPLPNEDGRVAVDDSNMFVAVDDSNIFVGKEMVSRQTDTLMEAPNVSKYKQEDEKQDVGPRTFAQTAGAAQNYGANLTRGARQGGNVPVASGNKSLNNLGRGGRGNMDGRMYAGNGQSNQRQGNANRGQQPPQRGYTRANQMQATA